MNERNIQDYLYAHPEVLFPTGHITEKSREYSIQGKRIDLLFVVDGVRYIVELKNVPIEREHIGQVVEYYGLMRHYMKDANLAMILVSSSIPPWRAAYLEELGIRCVEIPSVPETVEEQHRIQEKVRSSGKAAKQKAVVAAVLGDGERVHCEDIARPATPKGMAFAQRMLRDSLKPIGDSFSEYDVVPYSITRPHSHDFDFEYDEARDHGKSQFTRGGIWWAYRFGFSKDAPPNDVPNISIIANTTGLDITLNAELQPSQEVMRRRIAEATSQFDRLLTEHGWLWLKTYMKLEHQPRFYHWILSDFRAPGEFDGATILALRIKHTEEFPKERKRRIREICAGNKALTEPMRHHLETHNNRLNLAVRLVEPFRQDAAFWSMSLQEQAKEIVAAVQRMKPMVKFFVR